MKTECNQTTFDFHPLGSLAHSKKLRRASVNPNRLGGWGYSKKRELLRRNAVLRTGSVSGMRRSG
jgi:hypothetical protein